MPGTKAISAKKQAERDALLGSASVLNEDGVESTLNQFIEADAATIVKNIQSRLPGWTATTVLTAYIRRAIVAHKAVNCITEGTGSVALPFCSGILTRSLHYAVFFEDALVQAKELDNEFEITGRVKGPLHGVPLSAKDLCTR